MPAPAISVIMPVYNGAEHLDRSLESLRRQTLPDWEAIAIDDASTDATSQILGKWAAADPRVRVFRNSENRGASASRNRALVAARADRIAYLDHDDEFYPEHLARAHSHRAKGDVLLFRYDLIEERAGHPQFGKRIAFAGYRARSGNLRSVGWMDLGFVALELIFLAASRDTLRKYYLRGEQLLAPPRATPSGRAVNRVPDRVCGRNPRA